jgi:hypothetical protein
MSLLGSLSCSHVSRSLMKVHRLLSFIDVGDVWRVYLLTPSIPVFGCYARHPDRVWTPIKCLRLVD